MSLSSIPQLLRNLVYDRDEGRCQYCSLRQFGQGAIFHVDHIIPRSAGGLTTLDNLALQCPYCSLHKSNKTNAIDTFTETIVQLFHPLKDDWATHFSVDRDGTCQGLTATGRGTVNALRMNDPLPKTARAVQILTGLDG